MVHLFCVLLNTMQLELHPLFVFLLHLFESKAPVLSFLLWSLKPSFTFIGIKFCFLADVDKDIS